MIIYEFSTWSGWNIDNGLFTMNEIEVEEKPKSYIGKHVRILKSDINKLDTLYGNRMYRLDNDAKSYIEAVIKRKKGKLESLEDRIKEAKAELEKWEILQRKEERAGAVNNDAKEI